MLIRRLRIAVSPEVIASTTTPSSVIIPTHSPRKYFVMSASTQFAFISIFSGKRL